MNEEHRLRILVFVLGFGMVILDVYPLLEDVAVLGLGLWLVPCMNQILFRNNQYIHIFNIIGDLLPSRLRMGCSLRPLGIIIEETGML